MEKRTFISLIIGLAGFTMTFYSLAQGTITGAVIGTNSTSRFFGVFGLLLMIVALVVDKYNLDND